MDPTAEKRRDDVEAAAAGATSAETHPQSTGERPYPQVTIVMI